MLFKRPTPAIVIETAAKSPPVNRFDFQMRFVPQLRALFRHLNFQKLLPRDCLSCATAAACNMFNFWSLIRPNGCTPAILLSLLLNPSKPQSTRKTQCLAAFRPFSVLWCSFIFLSLLWLFPRLLLHLSMILSEVWLCNFLDYLQTSNITNNYNASWHGQETWQMFFMQMHRLIKMQHSMP